MENNLLTSPVVRQCELTAIRARIVLCLTDIRRIALESRTPGIADVFIDTVAMTVQFKEPWYREVLPLRVVVVDTKEIGWSVLVVFHKMEAP